MSLIDLIKVIKVRIGDLYVHFTKESGWAIFMRRKIWGFQGKVTTNL